MQDIDYLPEKGVDYSECDVPTQLSAEIEPWSTKLEVKLEGVTRACVLRLSCCGDVCCPVAGPQTKESMSLAFRIPCSMVILAKPLGKPLLETPHTCSSVV